MPRVIQLVGRFAGQMVEMPYAVATACVATGTAAWPEDAHNVRMRGTKIQAQPQADEGAGKIASVSGPHADAGAAVLDEAGTDAGNDEGDGRASGEEVTDWKTLHWKRRIVLAEKIAGRKMADLKEAEAFLTEHAV